MAHSWTGNLISCRDWGCFWLNEGFTMYYERYGVRKVIGEDLEQLLMYNEQMDLNRSIAEFGPDSPYTALQHPCTH